MIIHKCDRCGAEIDGVPHSISYPDEHNIEHESYELCDQCFERFKRWLKKINKFPCEFCDFEDAEDCPRDCFFDSVLDYECARNECQFLEDDGCCCFALDCKAFKAKE